MPDTPKTVRAALTETCNVYPHMPASIGEIEELAGKLEDIRRANLEHHVELVHHAQANGVQVICFGELFAGPYFALTQCDLWRGLAEDARSGPSVSAFAPLAAKLGMVIVAPIYEYEPESKAHFNTAVVINADGNVLGRYRKTHIPQGSNEGGSFHEAYYYRPGEPAFDSGSGTHFPVFNTAHGRIGVATCYDRHFEGVVRSLTQNGAQLIMSPAVTFGEKSRRMWPMEFQVDAMRHNVFIGGSNRRGAEAPWNVEFFGESFFTGPNGILRNQSTHKNLIIADLNLNELGSADPSGWNIARDTRRAIYE